MVLYVNDVEPEKKMDKNKSESADLEFMLIMDFLRHIYHFFLIYTT